MFTFTEGEIRELVEIISADLYNNLNMLSKRQIQIRKTLIEKLDEKRD